MASIWKIITAFRITICVSILYISVNGEMLKVNESTVNAVSTSVPLIKGNNTHLGINIKDDEKFDEIVLAVVACGNKANEAMVMMKSALVFSRSFIRLIIVAEDHLIPIFSKTMNTWTAILPNKFTFEIHQLKFPKKDAIIWKTMFRLCATQRLFFPNMFPSLDALLYLDLDSIFLAPIEELWGLFAEMNSTHFVGMAQEFEVPRSGWYHEFGKIPYYLPSGLNSGVMLMNLTRMREINWEESIFQSYEKYKENILFGDQDILNIIFHFSPEKVKLFSCRYNFRTDFCTNTTNCTSALDKGIAVLHGSRETFTKGSFTEIQSVFKAMKKYPLGTDPYSRFLCIMKKYFKNVRHSSCGDNYKYFFTKAAQEFLKSGDPAAKCHRTPCHYQLLSFALQMISLSSSFLVTTRALQPLDKFYFIPLKVYYKQAIHSWIFAHPQRNLTKGDFCELFCQTWEKALTVAGYRATGIYSLDRLAVKGEPLFQPFPKKVFGSSGEFNNRLEADNSVVQVGNTTLCKPTSILTGSTLSNTLQGTVISQVLQSPEETKSTHTRPQRVKQRAMLITFPKHMEIVK